MYIVTLILANKRCIRCILKTTEAHYIIQNYILMVKVCGLDYIFGRMMHASSNHQGPVVQKLDTAIHRIVIFSTVIKMLEKL